MIRPSQNPIQTVKDDKRKSCQYKLLLKPCEHLTQYVNVEVKFIQGLWKTTLQFFVTTLCFQEFTVCVYFLPVFSISESTKSGILPIITNDTGNCEQKWCWYQEKDRNITKQLLRLISQQLTSLSLEIENCTASSLSFFDGARGSGNTGSGAVSFLSRPK